MKHFKNTIIKCKITYTSPWVEETIVIGKPEMIKKRDQ